MNFNIYNTDDIFKDMIYIKKKEKEKDRKKRKKERKKKRKEKYCVYIFVFYRFFTKYAVYTLFVEEFNSDAFLQAIHKADTDLISSSIFRTKIKYL